MLFIKNWKWLVLMLISAPLLSGTSSEVMPPQPTPLISLKQLPDGNWQVEYQLTYPVDGLSFMRSAGFLREENWRVSTPGYQFARDETSQVLVLEEGAEPKSRIRLVFPVDDRFINRDYELFNVFSDGGLALFTGHFYVRPLGDKVTAEDRSTFLAEMKISVGENAIIALRGQLSSGNLRWKDDNAEGTYLYVGDNKPVSKASITAIFDQGLPGWVSAQAKTRIPEILAYYTQRMGKHSNQTPLVLFSYDAGHSSGYDYNGGTRSDLIQIRVRGQGWRQKNPDAMRMLIHFFAHEAAHLWNGQAARGAAGAPPWIHEGSAEAMAHRAMRALGLLSDEEYHQSQDAALNACLSNLANTALSETSQNRLHYDCGDVMALWSELALKAEGAEQDLFDIWHRLIHSETGSSYDQTDYFATLRAMDVGERHIVAMQNFVDNPHRYPERLLSDGLASLGVEMLRDDGAATASANVRAAGIMVKALLKADCQGSHGFYVQSDHLQLAHLGDCRRAEEGFRIHRIESIPLGESSFAAYHKAVAACEKHGKVTLGNDEESMTFSCPRSIPPLQGWWRLEKRRESSAATQRLEDKQRITFL